MTQTESTERWNRLRLEMPIVEKWAYFDHAAVGPLPSRTAQAITDFASQASLDGDYHWPNWSATANSLRSAAARLLRADTSEIALVGNTTLGIQTVALAYPWRYGDSVVLPSNEFPSNLLPWQGLEARGVEVRRVPPLSDGSIDLDRLAAAIDSSTRLVSVSWVGYATGHRVSLEQLCSLAHANGAELFVDAIQGLGAFPLDVSQVPIDYAAADGHKWMLGPEGAGILYIKRRHLEKLHPVLCGWNSVQSSHEFVSDGKGFKDSAARFEGGSANHVGLIGLHSSLSLLLEAGCDLPESGFAKRILAMAQEAREGLLRVGAQLVWGVPRSPLELDGSGSGII